jgi:hypothetical protein
MRKAQWGTLTALLTALAIAGLATRAASQVDKWRSVPAHPANCPRPDLAKVLDEADRGWFHEVERRVVGSGRSRLQWLFVSWGGPLDGRVFVLNCRGRTLAQMVLGYEQGVREGPLLNGRRTIEVLYAPGSGTNIAEQHVALIEFHGRKIAQLWDHASIETGTAPLVPKDESYTYRWRYLDGGARIAVTGLDTVGRVKPRSWPWTVIGRRRALKEQSYCFSAKANRYAPCAKL